MPWVGNDDRKLQSSPWPTGREREGKNVLESEEQNNAELNVKKNIFL